ncbi:MAG TPA: PilZ domain-containing protein [Myxococcales bacterium]|nr:PilZ domain-containing protein [Myxococcales bacterium]
MPIGWDDLNDDHPRRRHLRRSVQLAARLWAGGQEVEATCENISPGGAYLKVQIPETASDVVASIGLPDGRDVHVRATVRWRSPDGIGVEFAAFLENSKEALNGSA